MKDRDLRQEWIELYDEFTHGTMSRRDFMDRLAKLAGGAAAAAALVPVLQNNYAEAGIVPEDDQRLVTETVTYDVDGTTMSGYLARPNGGGKLPGAVSGPRRPPCRKVSGASPPPSSLRPPPRRSGRGGE